MTNDQDALNPNRFDEIAQRFARQGMQHQMLAGAEVNAKTDEAKEVHRWELSVARNNLAAVMILRRIRQACPEIMDDVADLMETAGLLTEFGVSVKLNQYFREVGGTEANVQFICNDIEMFRQHKEGRVAS